MTLVEDVRRRLGPVGVSLPSTTTRAWPVDAQRDAARRLERAGYGALWTNEIVGKDALVAAGVLLAATERLVVGTGVANVWVRPPQTAHGAAAQLAEAYPGRFVLGLGVSVRQQAESVGAEFGRPLATMRRYLERLGAEIAPVAPYARLVGALGPKMLALAAELADGAMPAMITPAETAAARSAIGPDRLLVVLVDAGPGQADPAALVAAHLAQGADHVVAGVPMGSDFTVGVDRLEQLAPALVAAGT